jgi:hypothetical protein
VVEDDGFGSRRFLSRGLTVAGFAMLPWLFVLGSSLPNTIRVSGWATAWVGLDASEGLGLVATGVLLSHRNAFAALSAAATATLVLVDAWFDVTTSAAGSSLLIAVAMAVLIEAPVAVLCATLAIRILPRPYARL